jgi:hypothetical protein
MTDVTSSVQDQAETELSRLNSSKALFALTDGEMSEGPLLEALASRLDAIASVYQEWAEDGAADGDSDGVASVAGDATGAVGEHLATVRQAGDLSEESVAPGDDPVAHAIADQEGEAARLGAIVGEALVTGKILDQVVGFFVGNADPQTAGTFRDVRDETDDRREAAEAALSEDAPEEATAAAITVVEAAYDDYVARLEEQGVNPKPVC